MKCINSANPDGNAKAKEKAPKKTANKSKTTKK